MEKLNLPTADLKISKLNGKLYILDIIRKKNLMLTPEEWVRQHFVHFLVGKGYSKGWISLEARISGLKSIRRTDILVRDGEGAPFLLVECKAPYIAIDQKVADQAFQYVRNLNVPYVILSNGLVHLGYKMKADGVIPFDMSELPPWNRKNE